MGGRLLARDMNIIIWISLLAAQFVLQVNAANFTFAYSKPRACDQLTIDWSGGEAPYSLFITPIFGVPVDIPIPSDASGTFTFTLPLNDTATFLLTMSDKNGFGTGGTSAILRPATTSNNSCRPTPDHPSFFFNTNPAQNPGQCGQYSFSDYNGATLPVQFIGLIPQGIAFSLIANSDSLAWTVNVDTGTTVIWVAQDAQGRSGGVSRQNIVQSGPSNCLGVNSPSSVANSPSSIGTSSVSSATPTSSLSSAPTSSTQPTGKPDHTTAILGGAIGGGLGLIFILGGGLFFWLRREGKAHDEAASFSKDAFYPNTETDPLPDLSFGRSPSGIDNAQMRDQGHSAVALSPSFVEEVPPSLQASGPDEEDFDPYALITTTSNPNLNNLSETQIRRVQTSKLGGVPSTAVPRFIFHTDAEDVGEGEVVEVPPRYRSQRRPRTSQSLDTP